MPVVVNLRSNIDEVMAYTRKLGRSDVPFAIAKSLTLTAKRAQDAETERERRTFDRPTPYTLRSTFVKPAKKDRLEASVKLKDFSYKGNAAVKFLAAEVEGGQRRHKRFEIALIQRGLMPAGMYAVPGAAAKLDRYGNIRGSAIVRILSALGAAERSSGYLMNRTSRSAKRGRKKEYFVIRHAGGRLRPGIWERRARGVKPIIMYVSRAMYGRRFDFYGVAQRTADEQFKPILERTINEILAKG